MSYLKKLIAISEELEELAQEAPEEEYIEDQGEPEVVERELDPVLEEVKRLTMAEMHDRLGKQSVALDHLVQSVASYRDAKHSVADIAHRLKDCGIFGKSDAAGLCKTCDRVHANIELLSENALSLKEQLDKARYEVE